MSQKVEAVVILNHQFQLNYEQLEESFSLDSVFELLEPAVVRELVNKELRNRAFAALKAKVNPPVKQKRLLAFNSLSLAELEELRQHPNRFESIIDKRILDMEINNEFFRILDNPGTSPACSAATEEETAEADAGGEDSPAE